MEESFLKSEWSSVFHLHLNVLHGSCFLYTPWKEILFVEFVQNETLQ